MPSDSNSNVYVPKSDNQYYKSWGGYNNFMRSYMLKPWDHDDIQEGKMIIEGMREADRLGWEEEQRVKAEE